ncbi:MAG: hypothetical protein K2Y21_06955 [Phycisphaerales bacterium]|nr:hypothetical protein [Phycisphaerales bacterium]
MNGWKRVLGLMAAAGAAVTPAQWSRAADREIVNACSDLSDQPHDHHWAGCGKAELAKMRKAMGLPPVGVYSPSIDFADRSAYADTDVLHNSVALEPFPATESITGTSTITVKSLVDGLSTFTFVLNNTFSIGPVLVSGNAVAPPVSVGTWAKQVTLDRVYNAGETFTVTIPYSGSAAGALGFGSVFWDTQGGQPVVSTLSQPYYAATWWPCKDGDVGAPGDNIDKATWEIAITHASNLTAVSNGTMVSVTPAGSGKSTTRWVSNYPMSTYLACFSVAQYNVWTDTYTRPGLSGGTVSIPLRFYIYSSWDTPARRAEWEKVSSMLDIFRPLYGEYPFPNEGYGIYQFPFGGGMEHQTMSGQGTFWDLVTSHELAHMWWGDEVTCRTWNDLWLNEGLASYSEAVYYEKRPGSSGQATLVSYMNSQLKPLTVAVGGTVYAFDTSNDSELFNFDLRYRKAAWVFHMLRGLVGDQAYFSALRDWSLQFKDSASTTEQFRASFEQSTGKNLQSFFNEWVYGAGAPTFAKGLQSFTLNGKNWTRFHIRQTQNPAWPTFTTPMTIRLLTPAGSTDHIVSPSARTSFFVRASGAATATDVLLDPNGWILNYGISGESPLVGPPVILETTPAAGNVSVFASSPSAVQLTFSEGVNVSGANLQVTRTGGDPVPFTFSYNAAIQIGTIAFESKLSPSEYTVSLLSVPASLTSGQLLDGDVADPASPASFPTGNGTAGTSTPAVLRFTVQPGSCPADLNADTMVDDADFVLFASAYNDLVTMVADFNGDGLTDDADFVLFADAYNTLECP